MFVVESDFSDFEVEKPGEAYHADSLRDVSAATADRWGPLLDEHFVLGLNAKLAGTADAHLGQMSTDGHGIKVVYQRMFTGLYEGKPRWVQSAAYIEANVEFYKEGERTDVIEILGLGPAVPFWRSLDKKLQAASERVGKEAAIYVKRSQQY